MYRFSKRNRTVSVDASNSTQVTQSMAGSHLSLFDQTFDDSYDAKSGRYNNFTSRMLRSARNRFLLRLNSTTRERLQSHLARERSSFAIMRRWI